MATDPNKLNGITQSDEREIKRIEKEIDDYLETYPKGAVPQKIFSVTISSSYGEPSYLAKEKIKEIYLAKGWIDVEFRKRYVESDLCNWVYSFDLERKVEGYEEEDFSSPLSKREEDFAIIRKEELQGKGEIGKALQREIIEALKSWIQKEIKGNEISPLIVIKRLESYCQKISDGKSKEEKVSREDLISLEKIIETTEWSDVDIMQYVIMPYPQVDFLIEGADGGRRWITIFNKNNRIGRIY